MALQNLNLYLLLCGHEVLRNIDGATSLLVTINHSTSVNISSDCFSDNEFDLSPHQLLPE